MATTEDPGAKLDSTAEWRRELYDAKPERDGELFSTISGLENEPLYTPDNVEIDYDRDLGYPGVYPFTRGVYPSMYRGKLWTMRQFAGFGTAEETNARFRYLLDHGQTGLSTAFDMPTLMGHDSDHPRSLGEVGGDAARVLPLRRRGAGRSAQPAPRDDSDGHPQGVHRAEGVHLPARAVDAARRRHDRVLRGADAALAPRLDLRLPHPRGRLERRAGARLHPGGRVRLRGGVHGARPRRRRLRAAALVLLQRPSRLLRGDRQVPSRAADLGEGDARALRSPEPALVADALSHADCRGLADGAAAGGEHRPHGVGSPGGRAWRDAVAAHELVRRGAGAADGERRQARAADAAGDRPRDGCREHDRPVGRLVLPGGPNRPARGGGLRLLRPDPQARRRRCGDQGELLPARDRGCVVPLPVRGRAAARDPEDRSVARAEADRARAGAAFASRLGCGGVGAGASEGGRGARRPEPDAADRRRLEGLRDDGRDVRRVEGSLGRLA